VNAGFDAVLSQDLADNVAQRTADYELMVAGFGPRWFRRQGERRIAQSVAIPARDIAPARIPCLQQFELDAQHRRLQRVQPRLMTTKRVRETRYPAVVAEQFDPLCQLIIVTGDRTCITPTAQIGLRVEAEASSMGERPGAVPSPLHRDAGAVRLPGILDDLQPECMSEINQRLSPETLLSHFSVGAGERRSVCFLPVPACAAGP